MEPGFPAAGGEFLRHYSNDVNRRWSADDLAAQQEFVNGPLAGRRWLDWTTEAAALQLWQTLLVSNSLHAGAASEAILLAGPIVEMFDSAHLLEHAAGHLEPGGQIVGLIPCLRDNSPESWFFSELARATLWPYHTAEELQEIIVEAGFQLAPGMSRFETIPRFNAAVLNDELAFKGFRRVFEQLQADGYDPMEVGWGELRFVATFPDELR